MPDLVDAIVTCLRREAAVVTEAGGTLGQPIPVSALSGGAGGRGSSVGSGSTEGRGGVTNALLRHGNGCPANVSMYRFISRLVEVMMRRIR